MDTVIRLPNVHRAIMSDLVTENAPEAEAVRLPRGLGENCGLILVSQLRSSMTWHLNIEEGTTINPLKV